MATFALPRPNPTVTHLMTHINNTFIVGGMRGLKHLYGFRPLTRIVAVDIPEQTIATLSRHVGPGQATFFAPNHPTFFHDWMVDKKLLSMVAPRAASFAAGHVVNGMGGAMQRFWLANNLIAVVPGKTREARDYSISWAQKGHGVLLHPEGRVGWHSNYVTDLFTGAASMAQSAYECADEVKQSWVIPIVSKMMFTKDVKTGLLREQAYIAGRLELQTDVTGDPAERVFAFYSELLDREIAALLGYHSTKHSFRDQLQLLMETIRDIAAEITPEAGNAPKGELARMLKHWIRQHNSSDPQFKRITQAQVTLKNIYDLGPYMYQREFLTQEEVAEHQKRIRSTYCMGTFRDSLHAYVPRPVGPKKVYLRHAPPIAMHELSCEYAARAETIGTEMLRSRMQQELDRLVLHAEAKHAGVIYKNPFFD